MLKEKKADYSVLISLISDCEEAKRRFRAVVGKVIDFKKEQQDKKSSYAGELAALKEKVEAEYLRTLDDSVFDKIEEFKKQGSQGAEGYEIKERALRRAALDAAKHLQKADASAAEYASQAWMNVADSMIDDLEKAVLLNIMKVLFLKKKMNYGNYSEQSFLDESGLLDNVGSEAASQEVLRIYKDNLQNITDIKKKALKDMPEIPRAKPMEKRPTKILDMLNSKNIGAAGWPWSGVTVENLTREI